MSNRIAVPPNGESVAGVMSVGPWPSALGARNALPDSGIPPWQGAGRVAGDAPDGLVRVSGAPASRPVWVLDHATGYVVARTVSAADGTWSVVGLSTTRPVSVWLRGEDGERDVLVPRVVPEEP